MFQVFRMSYFCRLRAKYESRLNKAIHRFSHFLLTFMVTVIFNLKFPLCQFVLQYQKLSVDGLRSGQFPSCFFIYRLPKWEARELWVHDIYTDTLLIGRAFWNITSFTTYLVELFISLVKPKVTINSFINFNLVCMAMNHLVVFSLQFLVLPGYRTP